MSTLAGLLKESWTHVEGLADDLVNHFYAQIFLADPGLRDLFPVEMTEQRTRMVQALVTSVQLAGDPDRFDDMLRGLGRMHRRFHIEPEHYGIVGAALLESLRVYSGPNWCIEYDQAWRDAYDAMATKMLAGARDAAGPAYWHAEVTAHERRGRDVAVFTCRPLTPYPFEPGQYAAVETGHQPRTWRLYSIANAPRRDGTLDFHVSAGTDSWVSAALVRRLRPGDMIRLGPPMGTMTADPNSNRDVVCVAGGMGLAPIKSLVDSLVREQGTRWVHVFVGVRDRQDLYDLPALMHMAGRYPGLCVVPACSDDPTYGGEQGCVNDVVERFGPWPEHDFYVSGSAPMVRATVGTVLNLGVPHARVRYDALV
jgi:NAD(P)H-flavin reductase/hemoglobin-like flavoprotein